MALDTLPFFWETPGIDATRHLLLNPVESTGAITARKSSTEDMQERQSHMNSHLQSRWIGPNSARFLRSSVRPGLGRVGVEFPSTYP